MHTATILLGSNINPEENINEAILRIMQECEWLQSSQIWETEAIGSDGPDFLNTAIVIETPLLKNELKYNVLRKIEKELGREREGNKYAPRTIDLDIILFDDKVIDQDLWQRSFIASPISDIYPDLRQPGHKKTLLQVSRELQSSAFARIHKRIN
jgi:2-amino-4-hydroxy-6-hydroxymethyldihydropteridine diphosphokinase